MKDGTVLVDRPDLGYKKKFYFNEETGETTIKTVYYRHHWEQLLDQNRAERNMGKEAYQVNNVPGEVDMWKAGSIPAAAIDHFKAEHGVDFYNPNHQDGVKKLLNDSDYENLRTGDFKL